ncbi:MAG: ATP-binding protein, partial [Planctomycetes bacterium]|nr:ATP-binding protein [Planctomycetota bacterium]
MALATQFERDKEFFKHARSFYKGLPKQTREPAPTTHSPPKDLIVSARRDLSFFEANYELFDNSIDEWRRRSAKRDLRITVDYDLELLTGKFRDNAGGMAEGDVFRVFIPGETTNRDFAHNVIGSFGMGAKKGIFRLTDGARIVSCPSGNVSFTSEVPQKWELIPDWRTLDGQAAAIQKGSTEIYFFRLFKPPTLAEIDELRRRVGVVYAPLLAGKLGELGAKPARKVHIEINGVEAVASEEIRWSSPKGAEPRVYEFSHVFEDFLSTGENIELHFLFQCGLTRGLPGEKEGREPDFGVDVYGNGRIIEAFLKKPFGFGTRGFAADQAAKHVRAQLYIGGHSFAIPWDTHKREYLIDHPVALWLYDKLRPILLKYRTIASGFSGNTELRNKVLLTSAPKKDQKPELVELPEGPEVPEHALPSYRFPSGATKKGKGKGGTAVIENGGEDSGSHATLTQAGNGANDETISFDV